MLTCPTCGEWLFVVKQDPDSMLNSDQFDAVKAGDFYCTTCKSDVARTGYKYWWAHELAELKLRKGKA